MSAASKAGQVTTPSPLASSFSQRRTTVLALVTTRWQARRWDEVSDVSTPLGLGCGCVACTLSGQPNSALLDDEGG